MNRRPDDMKNLIALIEGPERLDEQRVQVWSGATINVVRNPSPEMFQKMAAVGSLRGLLSPDGKTLYLWDAYMAVHPNIMQELGLGNYDCVSYSHGRWNGPVHDPSLDHYLPAVERLTPKPKRKRSVADDELLRQIFDDPDFAKLMGEGVEEDQGK